VNHTWFQIKFSVLLSEIDYLVNNCILYLKLYYTIIYTDINYIPTDVFHYRKLIMSVLYHALMSCDQFITLQK